MSERSEEDLLAELLRQGGLTARYLTSGVAGLGAAFATPLAIGMNKLNESMGSDLRFPDQYAAVQDLLTEAGLPEPEGWVEKAVGFASEFGVPDPSDSAKVVAALSHLIDPNLAILGPALAKRVEQGEIEVPRSKKWLEDHPDWIAELKDPDVDLSGYAPKAEISIKPHNLPENWVTLPGGGIYDELRNDPQLGEAAYPRASDGEIAFNPALATYRQEESLRTSDDQPWTYRNRIEALEPDKLRIPEAKTEDKLWRGMSAAEYDALVESGIVQSKGDMAFSHQQEAGTTSFAPNPSTAESYANSFAHVKDRPSHQRPAYVVGVDRAQVEAVPGLHTNPDYEIDARPVSAEAITDVYRADPYAIRYGDTEWSFDPYEQTWHDRGGSSVDTSVVWNRDKTLQRAQNFNRMEQESLARQLRATEQGYDLEGLHGSTHDIKRFSTERSEPGSDWGKSTYISTSPEDVSHNYAGMGPDLSARISKRSEELAEDLYNTPKDQFEDQWGVPYETYIEDEAGIADMLARQELKGQNEGVIYPLRVRGKDLVHVGGDNDTFLPMSERNYYEEAKADLDPKDYASEDEFQDEVMEYMQQLQADDADNLIGKLYDALQQSDLANDTDSIVNIMERATQDAYDGDGLFASRLNHLIRSGVESGLVLDDDGNIIPAGAIAAQVFEHLGFKGAVDNTVYDKFGQRRGPWGKPITGMAGVEPDTAHIIVFPGHENIIRSRFAKFDSDRLGSSDILAGIGGAAIAPAILANTLREQENEKWKKQ